MHDLFQCRRDALEILDKSIHRAAEDVLLLQTRKADLLGMNKVDPAAINLIDRALLSAKQELAYLRQALDDLRREFAHQRAA